MKIIDFIEPKKVKDIIEEIDSTLSDVGLAKLIEKLIYRYDKVASKKMTEIENNFAYQLEFCVSLLLIGYLINSLLRFFINLE